jgi:hypothetical protein
MKTIHLWTLRTVVALILVSPVLISATPAGAQQCSRKTTVGRYLVVCDGYLSTGQNVPLAPAKELATATADENGTFKSSDGKISLGGAILDLTVVGTEVVNSDCTGTITYTQTINGQPAPPVDIAFVVSKGGDKIDGLSVDAGSVFSCHLTRLERRKE